MPTRKQRRRREKAQRHEWEYVEIDPETGEERTIDPAELRGDKPERSERKQQTQAKGKGKQQRSSRPARTPQPPSWARVWKRTALFAPLMALFIYWTQSNSSSGGSGTGIIVSTVILVAFFAPFSYLVDSMTYRVWARRQAKDGPPAKNSTAQKR